ncbi:hypothetical protein [Methylobacterium planeticum]|uniref:Uncharacterized protein n=1 Tax=Methylobacterium planeticum TaxID=2615211 RepID=A0A6N6MTS0_9HYPH|nr:hypothetical protein [Methylobacterium planeticum]KAB1074027.1 hypothetical protein F6X51_09920 [Methylobacterium planeticum]
MEDFKADLRRQMREIDIATGAAADACLPGLLRRLKHHEACRGKPGLPILRLYRTWRIRRLSAAIAEARWHVEQGRLARMGGLAGRR